jgi:hypothetical protein
VERLTPSNRAIDETVFVGLVTQPHRGVVAGGGKQRPPGSGTAASAGIAPWCPVRGLP